MKFATKKDHAYYKGSPVQLFFKDLRPVDLAVSLKNILSSQLFGDFDETWYKERSHCEMYIL
jgi:hypothetical protein